VSGTRSLPPVSATARPAARRRATGTSETAEIARIARRDRRKRGRDVLLGIATPVVLVLAWQLTTSLGLVDPVIFTPPTQIMSAAGDLLADGTLEQDVVATLVRLGVGYLVGAAGGTVIGLALGLSRPLRAAFSPLFAALYAIPQIALLPLLLVIFGIGELPKILTVVAVTFFVMEINTISGIRDLDPRLLEAGRAYGATGWRRLVHVLLPGCLPSVFTGLRVAIALALVAITATEMVASNDGLGYLVWNSWQLFQPPNMYVGLVAIALLGAVSTGVVLLAERVALPWSTRH
jgi:sulfonate transport system permease protein